MNKRLRKHSAAALNPASVALVAHPNGDMDFLVPPNDDAEISRSQLLIAAVAFRSTDREWVEEQIDFIVEVRRQLDAIDDTPLLN